MLSVNWIENFTKKEINPFPSPLFFCLCFSILIDALYYSLCVQKEKRTEWIYFFIDKAYISKTR